LLIFCLTNTKISGFSNQKGGYTVGKWRNIPKLFIQMLVVVGAVILLILAFSRSTNFQAAQTIPNAMQQSYPPPSTATATKSGYPGPGMAQATPSPINSTNSPKTTTKVVTTITANKSITLEPWIATNIAIKSAYTPSPIELAAIATEDYDESHMSTLSVNRTNVFSMAINSINDLPNFVYSDPFYLKNDKDMASCLQSKIPGKALLIKALDNLPDYYLLPFYKDNRVCGIASIEIKNSTATTEGWSQVNYEKFPIIDANEAINQVILKTGKNITGSPILVACGYQEMWNPFNPAWQIVTEDGEEDFVISHSGIVEADDAITVYTNVYNSSEMHKIK
jgi:hypothetical protein